MRGDSGVAGEQRVVGVPKFHLWDGIYEYQLRLELDVQRFLRPAHYIVYYAGPLSCILGCNFSQLYTKLINVIYAKFRSTYKRKRNQTTRETQNINFIRKISQQSACMT